MDTVSHTLFYPLLGRAAASRTWPELFPDPWAHHAQHIADQENTPAQEMTGLPVLVYGLRHLISIAEAKRYLASHPGAAVINMGCGLDNLATDLADQECSIYNLDFPEVIALRHRWITPARNETDLAYSATDPAWMAKVDHSNGTIIIAPGVMYYLEVPAAHSMITALAEHFPGGRFTYDSESPFFMRQSEKSIATLGTPSPMPFKLDDPYLPRTWSEHISGMDISFNMLDYLTPSQRAQLPLNYRLIFRAFKLFRGMYQVRIDFAD